ncbi:MAG TPA: amidohydrolase family protein [Actinocrinis sp.]|nr:amidohydrolase family protein [Actinocrinis sp.]
MDRHERPVTGRPTADRWGHEHVVDDESGTETGPGPDLSALPLLDHHCHGVVTADLDRPAFEALLTEGNSAGPRGGTLFDSGVGMEIRRRCAPVLGLKPFATPDAYLERRTELGWSEVSRRFLTAAGLSGMFVDTGPIGATSDPSLLGQLAEVPTRSVLRLESIAEELATEPIEPGEFPDRVAAAIGRLAPGAVAAKTIAGYRCGLALPPRQASSAALVHAVSGFLGSARADQAKADHAPDRPPARRPRLTDPTIIRYLIGCAIDNGLPLQVHTGFGDADLNLGESDPVLLTPLLRELAPTEVPILLLHTYPFQRHAGYLAQVFDNVFCDVGLAIPHTGYRARHALAELLELAPYGKVLYSSDAYGLPELFFLGAVLFRQSLSGLLGEMALPPDEAARIALMIAQGNAQRVYHR